MRLKEPVPCRLRGRGLEWELSKAGCGSGSVAEGAKRGQGGLDYELCDKAIETFKDYTYISRLYDLIPWILDWL